MYWDMRIDTRFDADAYQFASDWGAFHEGTRLLTHDPKPGLYLNYLRGIGHIKGMELLHVDGIIWFFNILGAHIQNVFFFSQGQKYRFGVARNLYIYLEPGS